jgi:cytochrome d ubiquinol oxidase subunit I
VLYTLLLIFALYFGSRIIAKGPNLSLEPPNAGGDVNLPVPTPSV